MSIVVLHNQSLLDIAIRYFGNVEAVFLIATLNEISITDELEPGQLLQLPKVDFGTSEIVEFFTVNNKQPATAYLPLEIEDTEDYEFPQGELPMSL